MTSTPGRSTGAQRAREGGLLTLRRVTGALVAASIAAVAGVVGLAHAQTVGQPAAGSSGSGTVAPEQSGAGSTGGDGGYGSGDGGGSDDGGLSGGGQTQPLPQDQSGLQAPQAPPGFGGGGGGGGGMSGLSSGS